MTRSIAILTMALTAALSADEAFAAITVNPFGWNLDTDGDTTNVTRDVDDVILIAVVLINAPADEQELMIADLYDADPRLAVEVLDVADELGAYSQWDRLMVIIAACPPHPKDELGAYSQWDRLLIIAACLPHPKDELGADTDELGVGIDIIDVADLDPREPAKYHKGF
ncbi:MAG: hypothetical protein ABGZ17_16680 [Planctomycetaceae bacterium]